MTPRPHPPLPPPPLRAFAPSCANLRRPLPTGRRDFLRSAAGGFGALALASLLAQESQARSASAFAAPHLPARARRVIHLFCPGGLSHLDTFDHKPELERRAGQPFDTTGELQFFASKPGNCMPAQWPFHQHGESGQWISDLLPRLATHADDLCVIRSMHASTALHGPGCFLMNTGQALPGFPSMGAWITYGLGSEGDNLPAFVVLPDPRGLPPGGTINWGTGFLPAVHQATALDPADPDQPIADLFPPAGFTGTGPGADAAGLAFLDQLNQRHLIGRAGHSELEARIASYEMAARLQLSAPEATDLRGETELTRKLYDIDHPDRGPFGRQCLLARRLAERGVRFVQVYCGAENTTAKEIRPNWDSHEDLPRDHGYWGPVLDAGASALLHDLKARGMLEDTLVLCTTEFGRQPAAQGAGGKGRDHNAGAFTSWMAGGGVKAGLSYGATDELGFEAVHDRISCHELHATTLHLLGIDHERLTWYHNGLEQRLSGFEGRGVVRELLA